MKGIIFIIVVSICNIGLNYFVNRTAVNNEPIIKSILTINFLFAFLIGLISILAMLQVYRSQTNLPQGILLMGTVSILIGTLIGSKNHKLLLIEWIIFFVLLILFSIRWYLVLSKRI